MVMGPNLLYHERTAVYHDLLAESQDISLPYGCIRRIANKYIVQPRAISHIWNRLQSKLNAIVAASAVKSLKKERCGSPRKKC